MILKQKKDSVMWLACCQSLLFFFQYVTQCTIHLICELHNGRGDLWPVGLSLCPDIRLSHCGCRHDITGLPAQRGNDATGFSVWLLSVHRRWHRYWPLWFFWDCRLKKNKNNKSFCLFVFIYVSLEISFFTVQDFLFYFFASARYS